MNALPHVSQILRIMDDAYADVPQEALQHAQERGTILHGLCCQHLASMMDLCPKPAEIEAEYCAAYLGFLEWVEARDVRPRLVEMSSINKRNGYIGTPDALVTYGADELVLIDLKFTAALIRNNFVQVQMYMKMDTYCSAKRGVLVHINPVTGAWEEKPVTPNPRDYAAFISAINLFHWRAA